MRAAFFYDVACPFSYLVAERVERVLGEVEWVPAPAVGLDGGARWARFEATRALAERHAYALRLPLVWPDRFPANTRHALRAASYAAENAAGAAFALAAMRLAFCGGFDLEDPEILAVAAWGGGGSARGMPGGGARTRARRHAVGDRARTPRPRRRVAAGATARNAASSRANGSWPRVRRCSASTPL